MDEMKVNIQCRWLYLGAAADVATREVLRTVVSESFNGRTKSLRSPKGFASWSVVPADDRKPPSVLHRPPSPKVPMN
ncbi:MAG: hypothetical protein ACE5HJ_02385, partial [Thermoplasmata archaeon]